MSSAEAKEAGSASIDARCTRGAASRAMRGVREGRQGRTLDDDPALVEADDGADGHALKEGEDGENDEVERVPAAAEGKERFQRLRESNQVAGGGRRAEDGRVRFGHPGRSRSKGGGRGRSARCDRRACERGQQTGKTDSAKSEANDPTSGSQKNQALSLAQVMTAGWTMTTEQAAVKSS
jgi:hypothetical protein